MFSRIFPVLRGRREDVFRRAMHNGPSRCRPLTVEALEDRRLLSLGGFPPGGVDLPDNARPGPGVRLTSLVEYSVDLKDGPLTKLDSNLAAVLAEYRAYDAGTAAGEFVPGSSLVRVVDGTVVVDAVASADAAELLADLQSLGLQAASTCGSYVSGRLPLDALAQMAALDTLRFASPAMAMTNVGLTTSQGDMAMRSDEARDIYGVDGSGVKVGVLSDSFDTSGNGSYLADQQSGDLPGPSNPLGYTSEVQVLEDYSGGLFSSTTDEGRGIMQLIHDVAPGAELAFHTAFIGLADFADGLVELAQAGADVIVDDVIYFAEPMFQDGLVAQAVDTVVNGGTWNGQPVDGGVAYFSSAGNAARHSYESAFVSSGEELWVNNEYRGLLHDFDSGPGVDWAQSVTIPGGAGIAISFQWDQPFAACENDYDIYVVNAEGTAVWASSVNNNIGGDPTEVVQFVNSWPEFYGTEFNIVIAHFEENPGQIVYPMAGLMKYVWYPVQAWGATFNEWTTDSSSLVGHANAAGAEAVGAAFYGDTPEYGESPPLLEWFSSAGGTPILFDAGGNRYETPQMREKPEIVAPDGTNTTFFPEGNDTDGDGFPNFYGTSAAAPHAAAVAALMLEADATLTPADIYSTLQSTAIDMGSAGFDYDTGYGLVDAYEAVEAVANPDPTPPAPPTGLTVTVPISNGGVLNLDWADNTESDLDGYNVYRSESSGSGYALVNASLLGASQYVDTGLQNGTTYYYVVTAVDSSSNESGYSNEASATPEDNQPPAAPTSLVATAGDQQVSLDWADNTESDLDGYNVYRSESSGSGYALVNASLLGASQYVDTELQNGTTYYYVVTAVDTSFNESGYSNEALATPSGQAFVDDLAAGDIRVAGTISGSYLHTHASDNVYEAIEERESGGKPSNRHSFLEHKWTFDVTGGSAVEFFVEAYRPDNPDGDNFRFEYSADDVIYSEIPLTVNSDIEQIWSAPLPASTSGTLYVRVIDTNRTPTYKSLDTIFIDHMFIRSTTGPVTPVTDIAVTSVTAPASATQGNIVSVDVVVVNLGNQNVTSDIVVTLADLPPTGGTAGTVTDSPQTIDGGLTAGASATLTFSWDTTGGSPGDHTLEAAQSISDDNGANDVNSTVVTVNEPGTGNPNDIYVWEITWGEKQRAGGKFNDLLITVDVNRDADASGSAAASDDPAAGVTTALVLTHNSDADPAFGSAGDTTWTRSGDTDAGGIVTFSIKNVPAGDFQAEVTSLTHSTYTWNAALDADNPDRYYSVPNGSETASSSRTATLPDRLFSLPVVPEAPVVFPLSAGELQLALLGCSPSVATRSQVCAAVCSQEAREIARAGSRCRGRAAAPAPVNQSVDLALAAWTDSTRSSRRTRCTAWTHAVDRYFAELWHESTLF